ncbi:hypothetical protein ACFL47_05515 [Candidatus Latescibacterota bacterium]
MIERRPLYRAVFCLMLHLIISGSVFSQPLSEFIAEEVDLDAVLDDLPETIDLSSATVKTLKDIPFFKPDSARKIIAFRDSLSVEILGDRYAEIPGLTALERIILSQLVARQKTTVPSRFGATLRQGVQYDPDDAPEDSRYYSRIQADDGTGVGVTILADRDPAEPKALDLLSYSMVKLFDGGRTKIVAGDYRHGFGQGVLMSRYGRAYGSGVDIMLYESQKKMNTSFEETRFLRGLFLSHHRNRITTQTWYSFRRLDATLNDDGNAVTIRDTGYHRLDSERENLKESIYGGRLRYDPSSDASIGLTGMVTSYTPDLGRKSGESSYYDPAGSTFRYLSIDGSMKHGPVELFYEHVLMNRNSKGAIAGATISRPHVKGTLMYRRYEKDFRAYRAGAFSAFGSTSNERGVYSSIMVDLPANFRGIASMDMARLLYRTLTHPLPMSRRRINLVLYLPKTWSISSWMGYRSTDDSDNPSQRWNCRAGFERNRTGHKAFGVRSKIAYSASGDRGGPYGELTLLYRSHYIRCNLTGAVFDIPGYDARFYRFEYNLPGRGYTRAVWGRGAAFIAVVKGGPLSLRYRFSNSDLMETSHLVGVQVDAGF